MGFFSWKTNDTGRTIWNAYSGQDFFPVYMLDDKGNRWVEEEYEGYGVFGGKDFYALLAEMNNLGSDDLEQARSAGIDLAYSDKPHQSPQLMQLATSTYTGTPPEDCQSQGYFEEY
jgi:hypothetical protein